MIRSPSAGLTLTLGSAQTLAWASSYYLPAILAAPIANEMGLSSRWVFGAFSAALLLVAMLGPSVGRLIDRQGGRGVLMASNGLMALGLIALALSQGAASLVFAWLVIGVGMAFGLYDAAFATLSRLLGNQARASITGVTLVAGFASTIGWPITAFIESEWSWRAACVSWALAHVLVGIPLNARLPKAERNADVSVSSHTSPSPERPRFTMLLLAYVFAAGWFVSTAMAAHLPWLLQESGVSLSVAIAAAALVGPAQVAARMGEFVLLRRFHPLVAGRVATTLHPIGATLLTLFGMPAAGFALLHGAGNGMMTIASGTLPLALFGSNGFGRRQGLIMVPARTLQALAPLLFGLMIDQWGAGALWLTSLLMLVATLVLLSIRVPRG
ncbi:MFS transporter [Vreelandella lutescens]|uniref:MFS transporter n=1 Tax=Vreelandella lutescens TaxID=1602943 RepID=A0ABQ1NM50_9GAMM|nr:MFS transporter [Halomonas lutescens]GGC80557.1 MFS transporter [Halomonas lutescens]